MRELKLTQAVQSPVRRRQTFSLMLSLSLVQHVSCLRTGLSLGGELMTTQHNALLMEMLFLGSMLIIIVTNLAWEPVSQDLYPWWHSNSIYCPERLSGPCCPWLILCQSYLMTYVLGKGLVKLLTMLKYSFYVFSATSWEACKVPLKLVRRVLFLPLLMSMSEAFSVLSLQIKFCTQNSEWLRPVFGPGVKSSETMNLAASFTVSNQ